MLSEYSYEQLMDDRRVQRNSKVIEGDTRLGATISVYIFLKALSWLRHQSLICNVDCSVYEALLFSRSIKNVLLYKGKSKRSLILSNVTSF